MTGTQHTQYVARPFSYVMLLCVNDTNTDAQTCKTTLTYGRLLRLQHQDKDKLNGQ